MSELASRPIYRSTISRMFCRRLTPQKAVTVKDDVDGSKSSQVRAAGIAET